MALVVGLLGATAFFMWAAALYMLFQGHEDARSVFANLAVAVTVVAAVVWAVWHLRSKGSVEHRTLLAELRDVQTGLRGVQMSLAGLGQDVNARVREARNLGYTEAAQDFGVTAGDDDTAPPRNIRPFARTRGGRDGSPA